MERTCGALGAGYAKVIRVAFCEGVPEVEVALPAAYDFPGTLVYFRDAELCVRL